MYVPTFTTNTVAYKLEPIYLKKIDTLCNLAYYYYLNLNFVSWINNSNTIPDNAHNKNMCN